MASPDFPQALQPAALPVELVDALNQTYFLHLLANDPDKVVPPGKSLLSMLAHSRVAFGNRGEAAVGKEDLHERIRQAAHKAFWDEVSLLLLRRDALTKYRRGSWGIVIPATLNSIATA